MRLLGFLMIVAGLAMAIGYPLYQSDFTGEEFARERLYDRKSDGGGTNWRSATVQLSEAQNPVRIRLEGRRAAGDSYIGATLPVDVEVTGPDGVVLSAGLDMNLSTDEKNTNPIEQRLYTNAPDFDILTDGTYTLTLRPRIDRDISVMWMDAIFLKNVERPSADYFRPGLGLAGLGGALFFVGSRGRKKKSRANKPKKSRWGRQ